MRFFNKMTLRPFVAVKNKSSSLKFLMKSIKPYSLRKLTMFVSTIKSLALQKFVMSQTVMDFVLLSNLKKMQTSKRFSTIC